MEGTYTRQVTICGWRMKWPCPRYTPPVAGTIHNPCFCPPPPLTRPAHTTEPCTMPPLLPPSLSYQACPHH